MTEKLEENKRRQLTLFISESESSEIERVRKEFDVIQYSLIKSHITLCREDEIIDLERILKNVTHLTQQEISIELGSVKRFANGKGVLIPARAPSSEFQNLRLKILNGVISNPRNQEAHSTLMHPRNATCTDEIFKIIQRRKFPHKLTFSTITLIEQTDGKAWKTLEEFNLKN